MRKRKIFAIPITYNKDLIWVNCSKASLYDICEMLEDELREIVKKGDISPNELDRVYKAVDIIKDIKTVEAMEDYSYDGYSRDYSYDGDNMSYNMSMARRGRDGDGDGRYSEDSSYRRGRDSRGRYTSRDSYDGYSGAEDKTQMLKKIEQMKKQIEQM